MTGAANTRPAASGAKTAMLAANEERKFPVAASGKLAIAAASHHVNPA